MAVTSFGLNALCRGTDFAYRVDRADVLTWNNSHSQAHSTEGRWQNPAALFVETAIGK